MKWYVGADHAGVTMKDNLVTYLSDYADDVIDLGTNDLTSVDYPDYAHKVAQAVVNDPSSFGLLVCGTGQGMAMAANKTKGIRAALVTNAFIAQAARSHNNANVIVFGASVLNVDVAQEALKVFRETSFEGGRHQNRVNKLDVYL